MGNLGSDESALVPTAVREEMDAVESQVAEATGTMDEPVAPIAPVPAEPIILNNEPEPVEDPLFKAEPVAFGDTESVQGLKLDGDVEPEPVSELAEKAAELDRVNQKWRTIQGKYDAEMPRLHEELRESQERIRELEAQHSDDLTAEKVKAMSDTEFMERFGISEDSLAYGRDQYEFSVIQNIELRQALKEQIVQPFEERSASDSERQMRYELTRLMPTWEQTNEDPRFVEWLGAHRAENELMKAAGKTSDAESAVGVFKRYLGVSGQTDSQRVSLGSQIAPSTASSAIGAQVREGQQSGDSRIKVTSGQVEARLDELARGVRPDGTRITETEKNKDTAVLDAITGGTSKQYVLVP